MLYRLLPVTLLTATLLLSSEVSSSLLVHLSAVHTSLLTAVVTELQAAGALQQRPAHCGSSGL
jgi:hypothetical protein